MPQLDFANPLTTSQVVWGAIIFVVLYILLSRIALPKVGDGDGGAGAPHRLGPGERAGRQGQADGGDGGGDGHRARAEAQAAINAALDAAKQAAARRPRC